MTRQKQPSATGVSKPRTARRPVAPGKPVNKRTAAQRRETARNLAAARGRRRLWTTAGPVAVVLVLIAVLVAVKVTSGSHGPKSGETAGLAPASLVAKLQSVPAATLDAVGPGTAGSGSFSSLPTKTSGPALTQRGLPRVLYVGADYCPYCAAERWALAVALSRFGTFHDLGTTSSSPSDVYPDTQTLSFHGATLTSSALVFSGHEIFSNQAQGSGYAPLDKLDAADAKLFDAAGGSFPYVNIGGRYVISGASYDPKLLAGLSRAQIAAALSNPKSPIARAVDGTANVVTAAVCTVTGGKPGSVCTSPGVVAARAKLGG